MEGVLVSKTNKVWSSALSVSKANVSSSFKGFAGASKNILHDRSSVHKQRHISTITDNTKAPLFVTAGLLDSLENLPYSALKGGFIK